MLKKIPFWVQNHWRHKSQGCHFVDVFLSPKKRLCFTLLKNIENRNDEIRAENSKKC